MAVSCTQIAVAASGTTPVFSSTPVNASCLSIRNTGTTTVLLGTPGSILFPLLAGEFIGLQVDPSDSLVATGNGSAGTLVVLGMN